MEQSVQKAQHYYLRPCGALLEGFKGPKILFRMTTNCTENQQRWHILFLCFAEYFLLTGTMGNVLQNDPARPLCSFFYYHFSKLALPWSGRGLSIPFQVQCPAFITVTHCPLAQSVNSCSPRCGCPSGEKPHKFLNLSASNVEPSSFRTHPPDSLLPRRATGLHAIRNQTGAKR